MTTKLVYYSKKVDAVSYWKQKTIDNEETEEPLHLFQIDREGSKGAKQFIIGTLDLMWELIKSGKNSIYESWEDNPIHFAFDVDYPSSEITYSEVLLHIKQLITNILIIATQLDIELNIDDIVVLENENQSTIKDISKYSFHIIFRGLVMENYIAASKFYEQLSGIDLDGCDKSIYRKTCFRTCFSTKIEKNSVLVPLVLEIGNKKTDNENNYDTLKDFWKNTLICNTNNYTVLYTEDVKTDDIVSSEPSNNKLNKLIDLGNIEKILTQLPEKYSSEYFYWSKIGMILRNLNQEPDKCFEIFNTFSMKSPTKYKSKQDILKHWKSFKDSRKNKISVGTLFLWCKEEKISFTNNKSLESIIDEYPVRKLEINQDVTYIDQRYFPIKEMDDLWPKKLIGIQSEKGTGKTTTLFKYIFDKTNNKLLPDDSVLFISSRRTFGIKLLGDIKKFGFKLYSDCKEYYIDHTRMICQLDSILRLTTDKFKYVIIVECESLM